MASLSLAHIRDGLLTDPLIYAQNVSFVREAILFVRLDRSAIEAASFLDDRILTPQTEGRWVRFSEIAPLLDNAKPARPLHFIFHAGHVGSTLISRLLDEAGGVLSLREPLPLRVLAEAFDDADATHALASAGESARVLNWFTALWARGYPDTRAVVAKATSSAGRLSGPLLRNLSEARALYLNLKAEPYLATLLGGENSYMDLRGQGPERYRRLARLAAPPPLPLHAMSLGEIAALTWLTETLTQEEARTACGDRILPMDFDAFLAAPGPSLHAICQHFGVGAAEAFFADVENSPVLRRYSKAPEHAYTPQLRSEILAQSRARNSDEIRQGMLWLDQMARLSPAAATALSPL